MTTNIANDYIQLMDTIGAALDIPPIESIHIAPFQEEPQKSSKFGAMVLADGTTGITYTGLDNALRDLQNPETTLEMPGMSPVEIAHLYSGESGWQRSLGMAAINAISQFVFRQSTFVLPTMHKTLDQLSLKDGDHVGMVGYFPPLVEQVRSRGLQLTVLELDQKWVQEANEFIVTLEPTQLASCNKVICTGTVLINQTVDAVLKHCRHASQISIVGPTVGCLPDPLFERGVTMLGGSRVVEPERFIEKWSSQQKWRDTTERYMLTNDLDGASAYLGIQTLLSQASS